MASDKAITYLTDTGSEVKLSPSIIRRYLVQGKGNVTDQEVMMFLMLCKQQKLDPFLREAYLIKYGNEKPATLVTGKEVFTKRAERHPGFRGAHAGVIVDQGKGVLEYRAGSLVLEGEELVGGWAKIWKVDREVPYENSVSLKEYIGRKKDGTPNQQWSNKPATMIRKVALVQTYREAFPETFSGMYDADEMSHVESDTLDDSPVEVPKEKDVTPESVAEGDSDTTGSTEGKKGMEDTIERTRQQAEKQPDNDEVAGKAFGDDKQEEIF